LRPFQEIPDHLDLPDQRAHQERMDHQELMEKLADPETQDQKDPKVSKEIPDHKVHPDLLPLVVTIKEMSQKSRVLPFPVERESPTIYDRDHKDHPESLEEQVIPELLETPDQRV